MIYVASSWRNGFQQETVRALEADGHVVYDFRNPRGSRHSAATLRAKLGVLPDRGFSWREIDPDWPEWPVNQFLDALDHPIAKEGFNADRSALEACELCVLVMPCGRSAHLEAGYAIGLNRPTLCYWPRREGLHVEPELMYRFMDRAVGRIEMLRWASARTLLVRMIR